MQVEGNGPPLISLLSRFKLQILPKTEDPKIEKLLEKFSIPFIPSEDFRDTKTMIENGTFKLSYLTGLVFNKQFIRELSSLDIMPDQIIKIPKLYLLIIIHCLAFMHISDLSQIQDQFENLLECTFRIKKTLSKSEYEYLIFGITETFARYGKRSFPLHYVPSIFVHASLAGFNAATEVLLNIVNFNGDKNTEMFVQNFILAAISNNGNAIARESYARIAKYIDKYLSNLDTDTMNILLTLSSFKVDENIENLFIKLPIYFIGLVNGSTKYDLWAAKQNQLCDADNAESTMELSMTLSDSNLLPTKLTPSSSDEFEFTFDFESLISQSDLMLCSKMSQILICCLPEYASVFFVAYSGYFLTNGDIDIYLYIIYLYMLSRSQNINFDDRIATALLSKKIWTPGVSIYNKCDTNFHIVTFLRKSVLQIISTQFPPLIKTLLISLKSHPFLFAETLGRIHSKVSKYDMLELAEESTLSAMISVLSSLSTMSFQKKEIESQAHEAISTIIIFIFAMLDNQDVAMKCFTSHIFLVGFLSRINEESIQAPMIHSLRNFLSNFSDENISLLSPVAEFICGIIDKNRVSSTSQDRKLTIDLIKVIVESLSHAKYISTIFREAAPCAINFLINRPSIELLDITLQLFSHLLANVKDFKLEIEMVQKFSSVIRQIGSKSDITMSLLINILAKSKTRNQDALFIILEPSVILLIFSILEKPEEVEKMLNYFLQLCKYCVKNCQMCHNGALDKLLLKYIKHEGEHFTFRNLQFTFDLTEENVNNLVFPLINLLFVTASSPQIPTTVMDILVPKNNVFNKYSSKILSLLHTSVSVMASDPPIYFRSGMLDQTITYENFKMSEIAEGFSLKFQIKYDSPVSIISNCRPLIFSLSDNEEINFQIFIRGDSLMARLYLYSEKTSSIATLCPTLPDDMWHKCLVTVTFLEGNVANLGFSIDNKKMKFYNIAFPNFANNILTITLGGDAENVNDDDFYCCISKLKLYGLSIQPEDIFQKFKDKIVFSYKTQNVINTVSSASFPKTIYDAFLYPENIDLFVPLFKVIHVMPQHFLEEVIEVLTIFVSSSVEMEEYFSENLPLISRYLVNTKNLTYQVFNKLTLFFSRCNTQKMIDMFLDYIIFNYQIWENCDASTYQKIVSYWSSLYDYKIITIAKIIPNMRTYFWFEPIESELISTNRDPNLDIEFVRMKMNSLIYNLSFSLNDYLLIVSHCAVCKDMQQVDDMLKLLTQLIQKNHGVVPSEYAKLLFVLLKPCRDARFSYILNIICQIGGDKTEEHLRYIAMTVDRSLFINPDLFEVVLQMQQDFPHLIVISSWMSLYLGESSMAKFASFLATVNAEVFTTRYWFIPLLLVYFHSKDHATQGLVYVYLTKIMQQNEKLFDQVINIISLLCYMGNFDLDYYLKYFLLDYQTFKTNSMISLILFHILFHPNVNCYTNFLKMVHEFSVFGDEQDIPLETFSKPSFDSYNSLKEFVENGTVRKPQFMIRLTKDMNLVNLDLAFLIVDKTTKPPENSIDVWLNFLAACINKENNLKATKDILTDGHIFTHFIVPSFMNLMEKVKNSVIEYLSISFEIDPNLISMQSTNISNISRESYYRQYYGNKVMRRMLKKFSFDGSIWKTDDHLDSKRDSYQTSQYFAPFFKVCKRNDKIIQQTEKIDEAIFSADCKMITIDGAILTKFTITKENIIIAEDTSKKVYNINEIDFVLPRKRFLIPNSIEIFVKNRSYLLDFSPQTNEIPMRELKRKEKFDLKFYKKEWLSRNISTFHYLMAINIAAGRSINDPQMYPVMPYVMYKNEKRDFNENAFAPNKSCLPPSCVMKLISPQNQSMTLEELDDILFSVNSITELTPEHFSCPDMVPIKNPTEYVMNNRKMLENEEEIVNWIDAVFGYQCLDKFGKTFTEGLWEKIQDKNAVISMLEQGGQMPTQIFKEKHPMREKKIQKREMEKFKFGKKYRAIFLEKVEENKRHFIAIDTNKVVNVVINLTTKNVTEEINKNVGEDFLVNEIDELVQLENCIAVIKKHASRVYYINSQGIKKVSKSINPKFVTDNIVSSIDGLITIDKKEIIAFADEIRCLTSSNDNVVVGTLDHLVISFKKSGEFIFYTKIENFIPEKICITKIFGLIFCANSHEICLLTCNGKIISRKILDFTIDHIATVSTFGEDILIIIDRKGLLKRVNLVDGNLSISNTLLSFHCSINNAFTYKDMLVATNESSAFFVPCEIL